MAGQYGKLVNKQFNSPIKLYSDTNIREVLERETQMLDNGAVGINFNSPMANKPANLQHSAVLRFLEEEEQRKRGGSPSLKRVAWPPPAEGEGHLAEVSLQDLLAQQQQQPQTQAAPPQQQQRFGAAPQQKPVVPQPQTQPPAKPAKVVEPPPSTITLRPEAPVSQAPAPVITSQPATATLKGGKNLRGDLKWPPPETKAQMEAENQARMEIARGPVCRPRKVNRDYSGFFAQHALNSTYPGYKVPPGTQFYLHERSS
ncbi:hypothetical protein ILUMI_10594 [Ignelater luminosus]|uniref:Zasp-like motif domain-containing protein n=2 Tax=Elateroidea TaxID=71193 RepID=A0A8K0CXU7_IGNLU|nr:hypothetical protein ILUMI_10594 [Ignelater luminosus]